MKAVCTSCGASLDLRSPAAVVVCMACGTKIEAGAPLSSQGQSSETAFPEGGCTLLAGPRPGPVEPVDSTAFPEAGTRLRSAGPPSVAEGLAGDALFANRYRIVKEINSGGMGKVYKAVDTKTGIECAIKIVRPSLAHDARVLETLKQEARISQELSHPTLLKVNTFDFSPDGQAFIVMEYVDGEDLEVLRMRKGGRLPEADVVLILRQLFEGLAVLHEAGLVHRDLKPSNVMVSSRGTVKILDYGISQTIQEQLRRSAACAAGTPAYMPPEQIRGEPCDSRSDLYSAGMLALHLLAGRLPFDASSAEAARTWHTSAPVPGLGRASDRMNTILRRCLARRAGDRFQTAQGALAALEAKEKKPRAVATAESRPARSSPGPAHRLPLLLGLLVLAALAAFFLFPVFTSKTPPGGGEPASAPLTLMGDVSARPATGRVPLLVRFAFEGSGDAPEGHMWFFGDGSVSTKAAPEHRYSEPGTYDVRLEVMRGEATRSATRTVVVEPALGPPRIEEIFAVPASGTAPLVVSLSSRCSGAPETHRWDFGDGTTAEGKETGHAFRRPGTYRVVLVVANDVGRADGATTVTVRAVAPVSPRVPAIGVSTIRAEPRHGRAPLEVAFAPLTSGDAVAAHSWTFGDGGTSAEAAPKHVFQKPGSYTVSLRVKGVGGGTAEGAIVVTAEGPRTWTLGNSAKADFRSLADAVASCGDDDTILIEPGEYRVKGQIEVENLRGVTIRAKNPPPPGSSPDAFTARLVGEMTILLLKHCERIRVEGLRIETRPQRSQWNLLVFLSCSSTTIKNCVFLHGGLNVGGIEGRCVGGLVEDVRFQGKSLGPAQNSTQALHLWRVDDFIVRNCIADTTVHSFYLPEVRNCRLENCRIIRCNYGLYVTDGSRQVHAIDCDFRGALDPHYQIYIEKDLRGGVRLERTKGRVTYD